MRENVGVWKKVCVCECETMCVCLSICVRGCLCERMSVRGCGCDRVKMTVSVSPGSSPVCPTAMGRE